MFNKLHIILLNVTKFDFNRFFSFAASSVHPANKSLGFISIHRMDCKWSYGFLELRGLSPHVGDEQGVALAPDRVLQVVGQLGLSERDMFAVPVRQRYDHLLQEAQRLVDVHGLRLRLPLRLKTGKRFYLTTHSTHFILRLYRRKEMFYLTTHSIHFILRLYGRNKGNVLFNDALNTFYFTAIWMEGNVLFNDALNTFYFTAIWKEGRKCFI